MCQCGSSPCMVTDYLHWVSRKSYLANSLSEDYLGLLKQLFYGDQSSKIAITYTKPIRRVFHKKSTYP